MSSSLIPAHQLNLVKHFVSGFWGTGYLGWVLQSGRGYWQAEVRKREGVTEGGPMGVNAWRGYGRTFYLEAGLFSLVLERNIKLTRASGALLSRPLWQICAHHRSWYLRTRLQGALRLDSLLELGNVRGPVLTLWRRIQMRGVGSKLVGILMWVVMPSGTEGVLAQVWVGGALEDGNWS